MRTVIKATRTFPLDRDILADVKYIKGAVLESERVNRLPRSALDLEKKAALRQKASSFFATAPTQRKERGAFQKATVRTLARD